MLSINYCHCSVAFPLLKSDSSSEKKYHKIPIISPGLIFVQKAFLVGLYLGQLIFGGAYYWKEF